MAASPPRPPAPPRAVGGPPQPPTRQAASPQAPVTAPVANPFTVPETVPEAPAQNPFLSGSEASAPVVTSAAPLPPGSTPFAAPVEPAPQAAPSAPRASRPKMGAPLQAQPGVVAPSIKDPHAEFRKGNWKSPVVAVVLAAAAAAVVVLALPEAEKSESAPREVSRDNAVIGASVSPEIIESPTEKPELKSAAQKTQDEPASPAATGPSQGNFASAFKTSAK